MSMTFISGLSTTINNLTSVTGTVNNMKSITGNITKPDQVIYQILDYELLEKLPTIDGQEIKGEVSEMIADSLQPLFDEKVDKVDGKGLSENDFTDEYVDKLDSIETGAQVNLIETISVNDDVQPINNKNVDIAVPTKTSDLTNDSHFPVDANYVHTDNNYTTAEKSKLNGIANNAQVNLIESVSVNGDVQTIDQDKNVNIVVPLVDATLRNSGQSADAKATGDAITSVNTSLTQTASTIRGEFAQADTVLKNELTETIHFVEEAIPTKTSELTNDSNYTTKTYVDNELAIINAAIPTKTSDITNDSDYITKTYVDNEIDILEASIPTRVSQLQNDSDYITTTELTDGLANKEDTLQYGTATAEDIGKAMMPKTISNGKVTEWEFGEAGMVDDVQINGTSIVQDKVANIPIATNDLGVVKINSLYGIRIASDGTLRTNPSASTTIKSGTDNDLPLTPKSQHESTFYGLAKAAGDITQSVSSNEVGQYTDEAKSAIQNMLGIDSAIAEAISGITGFEFQIVQTLPATGEKGIIYLVPKSSGGSSGGGTAIIGTATVGTAIVGDDGSRNGGGSSSGGNSVVGSASVGTAIVGNGSSGSNMPIVGQATVGSAVIGGSDEEPGDDDNIYYEYIYVTNRFERIGSTEVDFSGYLSDKDIASDSSVNTMLAQVFG